MKAEDRIKMEARIVRAVAKGLIDAGYSLSLNDGEEWVVNRSRSVKDIAAAAQSVDEEHIAAYDAAGKYVGVVYFVYGNSGWDVVADYSVSLEEALMPARQLADRLEEKHDA